MFTSFDLGFKTNAASVQKEGDSAQTYTNSVDS